MNETPQQYIQRILGHIEGKDPLKVQRETPKKLAGLVRKLSRKQLTRKPAPDKWSIAEILAHLVDAEIVGSWRMRQVLGNNGATLQAFDQNMWAKTFDYAHRDPKEFSGGFSGTARQQSGHAEGAAERIVGELRHASGARQGICRPHRAHVRRT